MIETVKSRWEGFSNLEKYISNTICNSKKYIFQCAMKSWWGGWQVGFMGSSPSPPPLATTPSSYSALQCRI